MLTTIALTFALLQAPAATAAPEGLAADVARLSGATTNEERHEILVDLLKARQLTFTIEPVTIPAPIGREPRTTGRNVIVTLGDAGDRIIVGAHYDAARLPDGSLSRGAVDNAASSVLLVRLAERLKGERLPVRLTFVWFDMEELGLIGSAAYVRDHAAERTAAMLNFDVNAYGDTIVYGPSKRPESAALRRRLVETCAAEDVPCVGYPEMPPSDDRPFVKMGVPTVSIATVPALDAHQLWMMMNGGAGGGKPEALPAILRTIHTTSDAPDRVDEAAMARTFTFAEALIRRVAAR